MNVLVVDDERTVCDVIRVALTEAGHQVMEAYSGREALDLGGRHAFDLVFCDVRIGEINGFDVLRAFRDRLQPQAEIVLMTGHASLEAALQAVKQGANDYICKPFNVGDLFRLANATSERKQLKQQTPPADESEAVELADRAAMLGRCPAMLEVFKVLGRVAPTDLSVLISGESGTGKELIARAVHTNSTRAGKPFVTVNCGALTETLLETELFGHVKGAFTGAVGPRPGLFEEAEGGTILLDEVTETTPTFQVRLLRVLQEGEIRRVGSNQPIKVDVRVLATTNQDIEQLVESGTFRQDLMYRLNTVTIHLPPLRARGKDIEMMLDAFLLRYSPPAGPVVRVAPEAREKLLAWSWPGNVREMRHTMQRLVTLANNGFIRLEDLPEKMRATAAGKEKNAVPKPSADIPEAVQSNPLLHEIANGNPPSYDEMERRYVEYVLTYTNGNKSQAAEIMGVDRKTLMRMIERHGL
ncbi:MAG: sigma-54 dependent transcriptional regulator [Blastocatellia bacterium]|nr:sigma-54 dependent transcriptional regulator [Blastocatellia bacterium]